MAIKEDIKSGNFKSVYLMWGEENFLKDYYKKALTAKVLDPTLADFNYMEFNGEKPDPEKVTEFVSSYPFMSDKKVLYIRNSDLCKKANDADKKFWQNQLSDVPDFVIIIFSETEVDKRNAIYKAIAKDHSADEFAFQKEADLCSWIRRYAQSLDKSIGPSEAAHLIECCSQSMYILKGELDKLASYCHERCEITTSDIDLCCCKVPEDRVFDMIEYLLAGNAAKACEKYEELKLLRQEPIRINAAIFTKYNQLRKIKLLASSMSAREIAAKTGQKEYFVTKDITKLSKVSLDDLDKVLHLCADADHRIKNGLSDGWAALDIIIANMI